MMLKKGEMTINDKDISDYGARLLNYSVGSTRITKNYVSITDCTIPLVTSTNLSTRPLTVTITFKPLTTAQKWHSVALNKSSLDAIFTGNTPAEITLPDGYVYTSICTNIGELTPDGTDCFDVTYTFEAIMHDPLVTVTSSGTSNNFFANIAGNVAANCVIKMTPLSMCDMTFCVRDVRDYSTVVVPTITIQQAQGAKSLIIDGEKRTVTISGQNYMQYCDIISFPRLPPGRHAVYVAPEYKSVPIQTAISYYPTYV